MDMKQIDDFASGGGNSTETTPINQESEKLLLVSPSEDK